MFQPFDKFIYRLPAFPLSYLRNTLEGKKSLLECFSGNRVGEIVYIGSPDLYKELKKLSQGEMKEEDKTRNIEISFMKYLSRMSTRCTPFGLFATCSAGDIGEVTQFSLDGGISRRTRLDMYYLCGLVQKILSLPDVKRGIVYYPNNTIYKVGKYIRYIEYKYSDKRRMHTISSIERSKYLDAILKKAAKGAMIGELLDYFSGQGIGEEESLPFIDGLIKSQLLVSGLDVMLVGGEYLKKFIMVLCGMRLEGSTRELANSLCCINSRLEEIDAGKLDPLNGYRQIVQLVSQMPAAYTENYLFQVDASRKCAAAALGEPVIAELKSVISFFSKLGNAEASPLDSFKTAFYNRYEEREVPLAMALDPELGIGYPPGHGAGGISPLVDNLVLPIQRNQQASNTVNVQALLLERLLKAERECASEIVFYPEEFKSVPENWNGFPETLYALFQVMDGKNGTPLLNIRSIGDSAAKLLSRFAHLDAEIEQLVKDISKKESELLTGGVLAEIVHLPGLRVGNILSRPHLREYEIVYLANSDLAEENKIYIDDLMLSCRGGELVLRSRKLNQKIIPRLTSAHNYYNDTLPAYRFLCDMQYQGKRASFGFDWGGLANKLSYRPRVRYGKSILSLAAWNVKQEEIATFAQSPDAGLVINVAKWRTKRDIPVYVLLSEGDNELYVDFGSPVSIRAFLSAVKKRMEFQLVEFIFNSDNLVVKGSDGKYLNECIVGFYRDSKK